ncbi:metal ABC transporter solute-binding protein, Zn/Mn family [Pseudogracilibacillus auburnensis]|uniref:metal ABC transporter solute-binding protein, Zn/Mn family n=1 Tax=Pseudogracilibacillus auburnensis TaxID=1494959 RepID=UPI0027DA09D7|nr:zinc ABC transporter substrate-binding protein [Pseudogracilibacillus auburnensis]
MSFIVLIFIFILAGCASGSSNEDADNKDGSDNNDTSNDLVLYTSIYPMQYVVEQIAGEDATVKSIYPPGVDAHTYEPTSKEITDLANGGAFFYVGAGMEGFADSAKEALQSQKVVFVEIEENNEDLFLEGEHEHAHDHGEDDHDHHAHEEDEHDEHGHEEDEHDEHGHDEEEHDHHAHEEDEHDEHGHDEEEHDHHAHEEEDDHDHHGHDDHHHHDHGDVDPHIWLDPLRMIGMGEIVKDALIELNPENEEKYNENFAILKENMTELDEEFKEKLQAKDNKQIIVTHAAYGYWEHQYGIEQIPISGLSSSDEPSQKELAEIAKLAKEQDLQYVIFEQNSSNRIASIIQDHIGAEKLELHNLEVLVDEDIENNDDYLSLMKKNLEVLDQATK